MDNNIDLKNIWQRQKSQQPDIKEIKNKLNLYKRANLKRQACINIALLLTCAFIVFVWVYFNPKMITTKLGIVICVLGMLIYLFFYNRFSRSIKKIDSTDTNHNYIQKLNDLVVKQKFMQTTMLSLYFAMLAIGLCLYFIEYTAMMTVFWGWISYLMLLGWMAFNWFYFRPKVIKKQQLKLDQLIFAFEGLNDQLSEKDS